MRLISPRSDYTIKYRYHRIRQKHATWVVAYPYNVAVYELRLYTKPDQKGTEFALSGTAIVMDSYSGTPAGNLNNGNLSDYWGSLYTTATYKWFGIYSGVSSYPLRSVAVYPFATADGNFLPQYAVVEGSNDGTTWYCIGVIASINITTPQWQYYNIGRAAWLEYASGTNIQPAAPRYIAITSVVGSATYSVPANVYNQKVYIEISFSGTYQSKTITVMGVTVFAPNWGAGAAVAIAIDFAAGQLWFALNSAVATNTAPNGTFTPNSSLSVFVSDSYGMYVNCNFGHYSDTPFAYAAPAGFERIQV